MSGVRAVDVDLWFDPLCGWSWLTSRWVRRAAADRDLRVTLHPLGLGVINAPAPGGAPDRLHELAKGFARASAAVADGYGQPEVAAFYEALGSRVHEPGGLFSAVRTASPAELADVRVAALSRSGEVVAAALAACGLDGALAAAVDEPAWDEWLRAAQDRVPRGSFEQRLHGVPMVLVDGSPAIFGPDVGVLPDAGAAMALWDAFVVMAGQDAFFEARRAVARPAALTFLPA